MKDSHHTKLSITLQRTINTLIQVNMTTFESSDNKHQIWNQLKLIDPTTQEINKKRGEGREFTWDGTESTKGSPDSPCSRGSYSFFTDSWSILERGPTSSKSCNHSFLMSNELEQWKWKNQEKKQFRNLKEERRYKEANKEEKGAKDEQCRYTQLQFGALHFAFHHFSLEKETMQFLIFPFVFVFSLCSFSSSDYATTDWKWRSKILAFGFW